MGWYN